MNISSILNVRVGENFKVVGHRNIYQIGLRHDGSEYLGTMNRPWVPKKVLIDILSKAPEGIIRIPKTLTREKNILLASSYNLGYKYITRDIQCIEGEEINILKLHMYNPIRFTDIWMSDSMYIVPRFSPLMSLCENIDENYPVNILETTGNKCKLMIVG